MMEKKDGLWWYKSEFVGVPDELRGNLRIWTETGVEAAGKCAESYLKMNLCRLWRPAQSGGWRDAVTYRPTWTVSALLTKQGKLLSPGTVNSFDEIAFVRRGRDITRAEALQIMDTLIGEL